MSTVDANVWRATFDSVSRSVADSWTAGVRVHERVDGADELHRRFEAERPARLAGEVEDHGPDAALRLRLHVEDDAADPADGEVELVDGAVDPGADDGVDDERSGALERQPDGEQPLDDDVVEVQGDPGPIAEEAQSGRLLLMRGPLDLQRPTAQRRGDGDQDLVPRERLDEVGVHAELDGPGGDVRVVDPAAGRPERRVRSNGGSSTQPCCYGLIEGPASGWKGTVLMPAGLSTTTMCVST